jgi:ABC-type Fe3+ transport system substrate-binding protein
MRKKILILLGLMALSALIPASSVQAEPGSTNVDYNLTVMHPHTSDFYDWVVSDFEAWFATEYPGDTITVTENAQGGSSVGPDTIISWNGTGVTSDVLWGGGRFEFNRLRDNANLNLLQRYRVSDHNNFSDYLGGWDMWDETGTCDASSCSTAPSWYAAAISGFGFMYNYEVLNAKGLPIPSTWDDLIKYDYFGEIVMANPAFSGSTTANILQMLQFKTSQHSEATINSSSDSTEGWEFWAKVAGNVGEYTSSSSTPPNSVADGSYGVGLVIDYFAYSRVATFPVGFSYGGATTVSPDPAGILTNAPNQVAAERFMDYLTNARGQSRVGKFRTPANHNATTVFPVPRAYNWDGTTTTAFPAITPFEPGLDGMMFSEARSMFDNWFVQNAVVQREAWQAINEAANPIAAADALATYLTLPPEFNGTIQSLDDLNQGNTTQTTAWQQNGAVNFALAKLQADVPGTVTATQTDVTTIVTNITTTLPGGQTTVIQTTIESTISVSTITESAVSGFMILVIIPSAVGLALLKRYRKK